MSMGLGLGLGLGFVGSGGGGGTAFVLTDPPTVAEDMTFQNTGAIFEGNLSIWDSGAARGVDGATIPIPITAPGAGDVYVRAVVDGTTQEHVTWTLIGSPGTSGDFTYDFTVPRHLKALRIDIAQTSNTYASATTTCCSGNLVGMAGQSEDHRAIETSISKTQGGWGVTYPATNDNQIFQIVGNRYIGGTTLVNEYITSSNQYSPAACALKNGIGSSGGYPTLYVFISKGDSSPGTMVNDADSTRDFTDDEAIVAEALDGGTAGTKTFGLIITGWTTKPSTLAEDYADHMALFLLGKDLTGTGQTAPYSYTGPNTGASVSYDHFGTELWGDPATTGVRFATWEGRHYMTIQSSGDNSFYSGEARNKANIYASGYEYRLVQHEQMRILQTFLNSEGVAADAMGAETLPPNAIYRSGDEYENAPSEIGWSDAAHPGAKDDGFGLNMYNAMLGQFVGRAFGYTSWAIPQFDTISWTSSEVTVSDSNYSITTFGDEYSLTPLAATYDHWSGVMGFEIDRAYATDTAIVSGAIEISPGNTAQDPAAWYKNALLRYRMGGGHGSRLHDATPTIASDPKPIDWAAQIWRWLPAAAVPGMTAAIDSTGNVANLVAIKPPSDFYGFWKNQLTKGTTPFRINAADTHFVDHGYEVSKNGGVEVTNQVTFECRIRNPSGNADSSVRNLMAIDVGGSIHCRISIRPSSGVLGVRVRDSSGSDVINNLSVYTLTPDSSYHTIRMTVDLATGSADGQVHMIVDGTSRLASTGLSSNGQIAGTSGNYFAFNGSATLTTPAGINPLDVEYASFWTFAESDQSTPDFDLADMFIGDGVTAANKHRGINGTAVIASP